MPLPIPRAPASMSATRVVPMDLKVGDRVVDETGEWEVASASFLSLDNPVIRAVPRARRAQEALGRCRVTKRNDQSTLEG